MGKRGKYNVIPNDVKEQVIDFYVVEKLSTQKIADVLGIGRTSVLRILVNNNISRRSTHTPWNKGFTKEKDSRLNGGRKHNGPYLDGKGYMRIWNNGKSVKYHRYIWEQIYGKIPEGYIVHHIDGDKLNNNIQNLRIMTSSEHSKLHWRLRRLENGN